ncbi:hypothetical protein [Streptomyces sp. NBC_00572]|nr:hypothetical protein [Streptomyces sp. NBC_00572]MCX4985941.1 hypothetical protein [Streptomyces sp. NBC_00572]
MADAKEVKHALSAPSHGPRSTGTADGWENAPIAYGVALRLAALLVWTRR